MKKRSLAREFVLQILYQIDICNQSSADALENFWQSKLEEEIEEEVKQFSTELVKGVIDNLAAIDEKITQFATNWQLDRMAFVDRNILRLGVFELIFRPDIPPKVTINEAVELAKKFSGVEAGKFVNGILDKIKIEAKK